MIVSESKNSVGPIGAKMMQHDSILASDCNSQPKIVFLTEKVFGPNNSFASPARSDWWGLSDSKLLVDPRKIFASSGKYSDWKDPYFHTHRIIPRACGAARRWGKGKCT